MENAMLELPLALFTTLAPIGAGGFIALAIAFFTTQFSDEQYKKLDKLSFIPFGFVVVGFIASFFHLASPFNAMGVFAGLGTSPLSNEVAVGLVFVVVALIYCILAAMGKLSAGGRKGFAAVVAVVGFVFAVFTGMAYMIDTIPSWATPLGIFEILGFCLLGGTVLGTYVLALAGALEDAKKSSFKTVAFVVALIGAVIGIGALLAHAGTVSSMDSAIMTGAALVSSVTMYLVVFVVGAVAAVVLEFFLLFKKGSNALALTSTIVVVLAILIARLVFYAFKISVGL